MSPLLIYVSGPYSAGTEYGRLLNTNKAIDVGIALVQKGHYVLIPHLSHYVDMRAQGLSVDIPWQTWMEQDLRLLKGCDSLFFIGPSPGANIEKETALDWGLEVYCSLDEVPEV